MFEEITSFSALSCFDLSIDVLFLKEKTLKIKNSKKYLLMNTDFYLNEKSFANVYFAWKNDGFYFLFDIKQKFIESGRDFRKKDSIEIFLDTRNVKTKGHITKFCHHFVFFPIEVDGLLAKEITRFKVDDFHEPAKDFDVKTTFEKNSYFLNIFIPKESIYGFNVENKMGFSYRINRFEKEAQNFSVSNEYAVEKNPYFWATVNLIKN